MRRGGGGCPFLGVGGSRGSALIKKDHSFFPVLAGPGLVNSRDLATHLLGDYRPHPQAMSPGFLQAGGSG